MNLVENPFIDEPVVRIFIEPKDPSQLYEMRRALRDLPYEKIGWNYVLLGATEADLLTLIESVEKDVPLKISDPVAMYKETVGGASKLQCETLINYGAGKTSRMWMTAQKMPEGLAKDIENQTVTPDRSGQQLRKRDSYLRNNYDWDSQTTNNIWFFGPMTLGPNLFIVSARGVSNLNDLRESLNHAFQSQTEKGVLCEEPMRGVQIDLVDATLCPDSIWRGPGKVMTAARRCFDEMLTADPRLLEPVYVIEVQCEQHQMDGLKSKLSKRRGEVIDETGDVLKAYLPVAESFGFQAELRALGIQASAKMVLDHWTPLDGNPLDATTEAGAVVAAVRKAKGLREKSNRW